MGDYVAASHALKRALKLIPNDYDIQMVRFTQFVSRYEYSEAEVSIINIISRVYSSFECTYKLLLLFIERGKVKESVHIIKYMIEKFSNEQIYFSLLWTLLKRFVDNPPLILYFQARFYRSFLNGKRENEHKILEQQKEENKAKILDHIIANDPFHYDFKSTIFEAENKNQNEAEMKKMTEKSKIEKNSTDLEIKQKKGYITQKPSSQITDAFFIKEANTIFNYGMPRASSYMLELVENKTTFEFLLLDYKITNFEENSLQGLEKLKEIVSIYGFGDFRIIFELFKKCHLNENQNQFDKDQIIELLMENFEKYSKIEKFEILSKFCSFYIKKKDYQNACQLAFRGIQMWHSSVVFWFFVGQSYYYQEEFSMALKYLAYANFLDNHNHDVLVFLIVCLLKLDDKCRIYATLKDLKNVGINDSKYAGMLFTHLIQYGYSEEADYLKNFSRVNESFENI